MKKLICFFTIFVFWGITDSIAQGLHFGVKAGVLGNKANISGMRDQFKDKIFTFPPPDFDLPGARWLFLFAPHSPRTLVAPFRGAKSSHFRRRISTSLPPDGALSLLHAPR